MIAYKIDVLGALRDAGWSSYRIREEHLIGQREVQKMREGKLPSWAVLDKVCALLGLQPGDIIEYRAQ